MTCPTCWSSPCVCGQLLPAWHPYQIAGAAPPKPPPVKLGELRPGRCKRCRGEALRVSKVELDKLELFCKLCGQPQEVKR